MPDATPQPTTDDKAAEGLTFDRRVRDADDAVARIAAARPARLPCPGGCQVTEEPSASAPDTTERIAEGGPRPTP